MNEELKDKIKTVMYECYWDDVASDISNNNFSTTIQILDEIRHRLCALTPNREDMYTKIMENIDIDHMKSMIKYDAISGEYIYSVINFIISQIKEYGTVADEPWNEIWREKVNSRLIKKESLSKFFPCFFSEAFHRLERIEEDIQTFRKSELYQVLKQRIQERNETKSS
jgi:hypothetical protein